MARLKKRRAGRKEQGAVRLPVASPQRSEVSCTHMGSRQQRYAGGGAGNWKDIRGSANLHVRLSQSLCTWSGMEAKNEVYRSPWMPEDHTEITLSTYCQAAVRTWTFVHMIYMRRTRMRKMFSRGWDAVSIALISREQCSYLPLLLSQLENAALNGLLTVKKTKFSNWQKLISCVIWVTLNHNIHS